MKYTIHEIKEDIAVCIGQDKEWYDFLADEMPEGAKVGDRVKETEEGFVRINK